MKIFEVFLKTKSDSNIHQNALNCTIYKNSRGNMRSNPPPPSPKQSACKFPNLKKNNSCHPPPPPPPNPGP